MERKFTVALVGNPNSGKSSLFNNLTGLRQKVGNFPGITVEKRSGKSRFGNASAEIVDLPGSYSIYPKAETERITTGFLLNENPDLVILVADASNLKRTLLFATQIMDLRLPLVLALNMVDVADRNGIKIDVPRLSSLLGIPVVSINARKGEGIDALRLAVASFNGRPLPPDFINVSSLAPEVIRGAREITGATSDYRAFLLAGNTGGESLPAPVLEKLRSMTQKAGFQPNALPGEETMQRYDRIAGLVDQTVSHAEKERKGVSDKLDAVLTHGVWGYAILLLVFFLVFQSVFSWATYPMQLIEQGFGALGNYLLRVLPAGFATSLLVEGVLSGLSGIALFIPQIAILFGFITLMEDTGYMTRVSFLTDKLMRRAGLNGKSVVPLMSGFACAIPAIMATRNISNKRERLLTILITPFMSCSARLPVYTLLISLVIPDQQVFGIFNLKGLTFMGLYLTGIAVALASAMVLSRLIRVTEKSWYVMEMPVYQSPRWGNILITMIEKAKIFVVEAGKVILVISVILWLLASTGPGGAMKKIDAHYTSLVENGSMTEAEAGPQRQSEKITASWAGVIGRTIEPVLEPMGFNWKLGIALVTSFAAREVFVGTMSTIYAAGGGKEVHSIREHMANEKGPGGAPFYTLAVGLSLMIFYAFAMQCMSTLAVVRRETGSWKWPLFQLVYMTGLAFAASTLVYQLLA